MRVVVSVAMGGKQQLNLFRGAAKEVSAGSDNRDIYRSRRVAAPRASSLPMKLLIFVVGASCIPSGVYCAKISRVRRRGGSVKLTETTTIRDYVAGDDSDLKAYSQLHNDAVVERELTTPNYSNRDVIARFLEQATFGPTRDGIDEVESLEGGFAEWISDQMDTTKTAPTLHRAFFRSNANARFEFPFHGGAVTHPCQKDAKYRLYALTNKDVGRTMTIQTTGLFKKVIIGGFVRTLVSSAHVSTLGQYSVLGSNAPIELMKENVPYKLCNIDDAYIDESGASSYVGVQELACAPTCPSYYPGVTCCGIEIYGGCSKEVWFNNKYGNAKIMFDMTSASPNHMIYLNDSPSAAEESMTANYGGLGRTPAVQELSLTEDIYNMCGNIGSMTGNPEDPVFIFYDNNFWIHDPRFMLRDNTVESPLIDGGGELMKGAENIPLDPAQSPVTLTGLGDANRIRCANAPRTFINEAGCMRSPSEDVCGHIVVCGSPGEIASNLTLGGEAGASGGAFDVNTLKHVTRTLQYRENARKDVWITIAITAKDQLRQRVAWALSQILVISPTSLEQTGLMTEAWTAYYDIFTRHAFGNYRDVLKEVSYSPMMGEMLTYVESASTAFVEVDRGLVQFPDENFAREIMQLFSIGLKLLNQDGSEITEDGEPILSYTNEDIEDYAKVWTGFTRQGARGNMERHYTFNRVDPMKLDPLKRDVLPKMGLFKKYVGHGYPLCIDLPEKHFLKAGAKYYLVDSSGQPEMQVDNSYWVSPLLGGTLPIQRLVADPSGELYAELCQSVNGECQYPAMLQLANDLTCMGEECNVDTIRTIQVEPGIFYEYVRPPCVEQAFYSGAKKVVPYNYLSGPNHVGDFGPGGSGFIMCANPQLEAANSACCSSSKCASCGSDDAYDAYSTDQMYWGERMRYETSEQRCLAAGGLCPLPHMGTWCGDHVQVDNGCDHIWYNTNLEQVDGSSVQAQFWTTDPCTIQAKVDLKDGKVGIVHSTSHDDSLIAAHVQRGTKTLFRVDWGSASLSDVVAEVSGSSSCVDSGDGARICDVTVVDAAVFSDATPPSSTDDVLSQLSFGAFHPSETAPSDGFVQSTSDNGVTVHHINGVYSMDSVFEVIDQNGVTHLRKNRKSVVSIDGTDLSFRNPVHMISLVDPEPRDMHYETDAALDQYFYHPNTAPFLAIRFAQRFGISNPSKRYVSEIATAFRTGSYTPHASSTSYGSGKYGDIGAMVAAVLLDDEARNTVHDAEPDHGSLGEPLIRLIKLMRALDFEAAPHHRLTGFRSGGVGQMAHEAPSVFSFFLPEFSPSGTRISQEAGRTSPESQLLTSPNVMNMLNIIYSLTRFGLDECYYGLASWGFSRGGVCLGKYNWGNMTYVPALGSTSDDIINELATLMTAGRLSDDNRAIAKAVYDNADASAVDPLVITQQVIASSSEFHALGSSNVKSGEPRPVPSSLPALPATPDTPYRAVVYLMLAGGYDSWNLLVPHVCHDTNSEGEDVLTQYLSERGVLALTEAERNGNEITVDPAKEAHAYGVEGAEPCSEYAIHPNIPVIRNLFRDGHLSFFANAGALNEPVTKNNYNLLMKELFAHNTMQSEAQRVDPFDKKPDTGILGRALDILANKNVPGTYRKYNVNSMSIDKPSMAIQGIPFRAPSPRIVSRFGPAPYNPATTGGGIDPWDIRAAVESVNNATSDDSNMYGELWSSSLLNAIHESEELEEYLDGISLKTGDIGGKKDWWKDMMTMLLKLIQTREDRNVDRDVFYIELSNWDHHSETKTNFASFLTRLNTLLDKFVEEVAELGLWDQVTLVSSSDFGRTLVPNTGKGSDHAWGGHYFVMGGSVDGGQIHGQYPSDITANGELNIGRGRGRMIPTLSWESIWNGVLEWIGVEGDEDLDKCMPNRHSTGTRLFKWSDVFIPGPPTSAPLPTESPTKSAPVPEPVPTFSPVASPVVPTKLPTSSPSRIPTGNPTKAPISPLPTLSESLTNLALGKSTLQSSTPLYPAGQSSNAVDGNTNGIWGYGSVTYSNAHGWWQVDLGAMYPIHSVKVYNRQDCCKNLLDVITIIIFNDLWGIVKIHTLSSSSSDIVEWMLDVPLTGMRVQIQNPQILNMAEVEVYGVLPPPAPTPPLTNLALGRPTLQSATQHGGAAGRAVDGNTDGNFWAGSVSHTWYPGWWNVYLDGMRKIYRVKIYNRQDCCKEHMNSIDVKIFGTNHIPNLLKSTTLTGTQPDTLEWVLDQPTFGHIVQVYSPLFLMMAEVEVFGV